MRVSVLLKEQKLALVLFTKWLLPHKRPWIQMWFLLYRTAVIAVFIFKNLTPLLTVKYIFRQSKRLLDARLHFTFAFSAPGSSTDEGGPAEGESNYPGWSDQVESSAGGRRPGSLDRRTEEKDRRMEERKTKALNMLSKLQDNTPRRQNSNKGRSNFEDCEFTI